MYAQTIYFQYHTEGANAVFYIQGSQPATALKACSRRITNARGFKVCNYRLLKQRLMESDLLYPYPRIPTMIMPPPPPPTPPLFIHSQCLSNTNTIHCHINTPVITVTH